jgi:hypothetical protein
VKTEITRRFYIDGKPVLTTPFVSVGDTDYVTLKEGCEVVIGGVTTKLEPGDVLRVTKTAGEGDRGNEVCE